MSYKILLGNNLDVLPTLPDNSVDSIVTDPPYELGFMGKKWDSSGIAYSVELWQQCLRVLKPGGHLLAFSGSRTYHRMVVSIEDAGFEIRDMISWISNKTFPKSLNIGKAIDKIQEVNTNEWHGWGTGLKPTVEPIVMARKPIEGTVANNVLTYGTGGLNIDASRIGFTSEQDIANYEFNNNGVNRMTKDEGEALGLHNGGWKIKKQERQSPQGRWPANIILDPYTAELLDEQSGISKGQIGMKRISGGKQIFDTGGRSDTQSFQTGVSDEGGASRFFYVAKASKRDRNEGLEELDDSKQHKWNGSVGHRGVGDYYPDGTPRPVNPMKNFHPTVKPTALMEYLIKLVTPPNGIVLDPFTGSGSTGKAAILQGFDFIGVEMTEDYLPIIEGRLKHAEQLVAEAKEQEKLKKTEKLF